MKADTGFCKSRFLRIRGRLARKRLAAEAAGEALPRTSEERQKWQWRAEDFAPGNTASQQRDSTDAAPDNKRRESRESRGPGPIVRYLRREFSR